MGRASFALVDAKTRILEAAVDTFAAAGGEHVAEAFRLADAAGRIEDQRGDVAEAVHVYKGLGECYNSRGRVGCDVLPKRISLAGEGKAGFMV